MENNVNTNIKIKKPTYVYRYVFVVAVALMVSSISGYSHAYFSGSEAATHNELDVNVVIEAAPDLISTYDNGVDSLGISAMSLYSNDANYTSSVYPKISIDFDQAYSRMYNVVLDVKVNNFINASDTTSDLLLKVVDYNGSEITSIDGLSYVTVGGVSGFDITDLSVGKQYLKKKVIISTTDVYSIVSHAYDVSLIFVNYESSSSYGSSSFDATVYFE